MKNKKINKLDLVCLRNELGATIYRVVEISDKEVGLIDATIEDRVSKQRVNWVDVSLVMTPSREQLSDFNQGVALEDD